MTTATPKCRIAVLISGSGTNLQAFIDRIGNGGLDAKLELVVSNKPRAFGLERAERAGIPTACIEHGEFASREAFDRRIAAELDAVEPALIVLAGFMRILSPWFVRHFEGRILNIHPALLPKYPGLDTHSRVLAAGDAYHGSTVHFVNDELDGGPRVLAGRVCVERGDTPESLKSRVQKVEHRIYPQAAQWFAQGRLCFKNGNAVLDGRVLNEPVVQNFR